MNRLERWLAGGTLLVTLDLQTSIDIALFTPRSSSYYTQVRLFYHSVPDLCLETTGLNLSPHFRHSQLLGGRIVHLYLATFVN
jgi:hypothetical protein